MKRFMLSILLSLVPLLGMGQTTLQTVDFETAGSGYTITGAQTTTGDDWFERTDGTTVLPDNPFTGKHGTYFFYAEDTDNGRTTDAPVYVTLDSLDVSNYTNIQVKLLLAANNNVDAGKEKTEYLIVQYAFDGGSFSSRVQFIAPSVNATYYAEDANMDGTTDGASLSPAFTEFTYSIPGSGANVQIRIAVNVNSGREEVGFDYIRVLGTEANTSVVLYDFFLRETNGEIFACWQTASEENSVGFDLLRWNGAAWAKVNEGLIFARNPMGADYCVADPGANGKDSFLYKLVEHESDGSLREYGPFERAVWSPRLENVGVDARGVTLRWLSREGESYDVLMSPSLMAPPETIADGLTATPPVNEFTDENQRQGSAFYQIRVAD